MKTKSLLIIVLTFITCKENNKIQSEHIDTKKDTFQIEKIDLHKSDTINQINYDLDGDGFNEVEKIETQKSDTIQLSLTHKVNKISCDLDGDGFNETVEIVRNIRNQKSGLCITFGDKKRIDYFGMGENILGQRIDEFDWVGIFKIAPKNNMYWNNSDGEILSEDEIKESDKIKLLNDGIFIHALESCGGGIIYLDDGVYKWIQQE